jgi:hypothetical protein
MYIFFLSYFCIEIQDDTRFVQFLSKLFKTGYEKIGNLIISSASLRKAR